MNTHKATVKKLNSKAPVGKSPANLPATAQERKIVASQMPLIRQISNAAGLRDMVIEAWVRCWRESDNKDLGKAPFRCELEGDIETLVRHTNATAKMTIAAAKEFERIYQVTLNRDWLLAGAILHDVDKVILQRRNENKVEITERARQIVHGKYGAEIAEQVGIPRGIVNIIASHSANHPSEPPASAEAILVARVDGASYDSYPFLSGRGVFAKP